MNKTHYKITKTLTKIKIKMENIIFSMILK